MKSHDISIIAKRASALARDFNAQSTVSIYDLLQKTGYFDHHAAIGEQELATAVASEPDAMDAWLRYSENKRGGDGWYIVVKDGGYVVGHLGSGDKFNFADRLDAVSFFAKHELEAIRTC